MRLRSLAGLAAAFLFVPSLVLSQCSPDYVDLRGDWGKARFRVEVADTAAERAQGLMHRETLGRSAGMLFVYETPRKVTFWMKNTLIPLDILFFDIDGTLLKIHENAQPLDTTTIDGAADTFAALEINGGLSRQIGLAVGDQIRHPEFDGDSAIWPCEAS